MFFHLRSPGFTIRYDVSRLGKIIWKEMKKLELLSFDKEFSCFS